MKKLLVALTCLWSSIGNSQNSDYFVVESDTTFCTYLSYTLTVQSYLATVSYLNSDRKRVVFKGRTNIPNITTFYINGKTIDRIPQKTDKPDKYIKWAERVVDGKLIVNYYNNEISTSNQYSDGSSKNITTGVTKFFIKLPDGVFYDINKSSDMKKHIIPYLENCEAFKMEYKGDYSRNYEEFIETVKLYNSRCN